MPMAASSGECAPSLARPGAGASGCGSTGGEAAADAGACAGEGFAGMVAGRGGSAAAPACGCGTLSRAVFVGAVRVAIPEEADDVLLAGAPEEASLETEGLPVLGAVDLERESLVVLAVPSCFPVIMVLDGRRLE